MENQEGQQKARKRVESRIGFYIHLGVFLAVCSLLLMINLRNSPAYFWVQWPIMGWGIGVLFHAAGVFFISARSEIVNKMIEKEWRKEEEAMK